MTPTNLVRCIVGNTSGWDSAARRHPGERVAPGEIWDSAGFSRAELSLTEMAAHLGDNFECQRDVMHLLPLSSDLRLLRDRVQREGYPRRTLAHPLHHLAEAMWSLLLTRHVSEEQSRRSGGGGGRGGGSGSDGGGDPPVSCELNLMGVSIRKMWAMSFILRVRSWLSKSGILCREKESCRSRCTRQN